MVQSPSWEGNRFAASQEIPRILCNPKVHYRFTSTNYLSLSWASSIQSIPPHPTPWRSILILPSHLHLGLSSGLFPSGFHTKPCICLSSPRTRYMSLHPNLDFITRTIFGVQQGSSVYSLCSVLHSLVTSSLLPLPCNILPLRTNILLITLFSNSHSLRSSLNVSDQVSHPYKTSGRII